jgi:hypothetical protein
MNAYDEFLEKQKSPKIATIEDGITLCKILEKVLRGAGLFPALTGGLLYKEGGRKDIDIVLYRHRQQLECFEVELIESLLESVGVTVTGFYGFVTKAKWEGFVVDIFNPETNLDGGAIYDEEVKCPSQVDKVIKNTPECK